MTIKTLVPIITLFFYFSAVKAQIVSDNFSDGNFSENPEWTGDVTEFIVNEDLQLQLNFTDSELRPAYLSTLFDEVNLDEKEWRFDIRLDFSPSNTNKVVVYLASNTSNLLDFSEDASTQEGYFLEIGENGNNDAISLFYRNGSTTNLIARGIDGEFSGNFNTRFRVRRDATGNWEIATADIGSENFSVTAIGTDYSYNLAQNLGFICYFTATRSDIFFFDNIYFVNHINDTIPPNIIDYNIINEQNITLYFSEELDSLSAVQPDQYSLEPGKVTPSSVYVDNDSVTLSFSRPFESGIDYALSIENITDLSGNIMESEIVDFLYYEIEEADYRDIVINEFLANTNPSQGLPEAEFIELYNRSDKFISLKDWRITDNTSSEGVLPDYILAPKAYLILCPSSALSQYESFGPTIAPSSWQILNITGDSISLKNNEGGIIDALEYTREWYQDEDKENGGYSIELINTDLPCYDPFLWKASSSNIGGTPGTINSVVNADFKGNKPVIKDYYFPDPDRIVLQFDKSMDLNSLQTTNYLLEPSLTITAISTDSTESNTVELILEQSLQNNESYELRIDEVQDCNGNSSHNLTIEFTFDNVPPKVENYIFLSDSILLLRFDEAVTSISATELENYQLEPLIVILDVDLISDNEVILFYNQSFNPGSNYSLTINALADKFGNAIDHEVYTFLFEGANIPGFNQLVITEIMAKPATDQVLPDVQYIELYNATEKPISLVDLKYMDARDTVNLGLNYILPNEYLIVCPNSRLNQMTSFGRAIGLSPWPNLNNAGDDLQIINQNNDLVHQVFYRDSWYKEDYKKTEGGWSLEMIDTRNPCTGFSNWTASRAQLKGSPGKLNSVLEDNPDLKGPELVKAFAALPKEVEVVFNETLQLPDLRKEQFSIEPSVSIKSVKALNSNTVRLILEEELQLKQKYSVIIDQITDCAGNLISSEKSSVTFGLVEEPEQNDIVLNEVLYHPNTGGVDFIELYNRSEKFINLKNWQAKGSTQQSVLFAGENMVMAPGDIIAITTDSEILINHYPNSSQIDNIKVTALPNFINEEGVVHIISENEALEEFFEYNDDLHIPFLRTSQGVSLERISAEAEIDKINSWKSAASSSGYATPGMVNSQLAAANISYGEIKANPPSFAHDAPGRNYTIINYELKDVGNLATVKIFDATGTLVKTLANNETLNTTGFFRWDGDDNSGRKVITGYYIIYFELFSSAGNTRIIKERVAVGANF